MRRKPSKLNSEKMFWAGILLILTAYSFLGLVLYYGVVCSTFFMPCLCDGRNRAKENLHSDHRHCGSGHWENICKQTIDIRSGILVGSKPAYRKTASDVFSDLAFCSTFTDAYSS